jgi:DNA-binding response OmpR family regulator
MRVLVLEDDEILSEIICEYLKGKGYEVHEHFDGLEAYTCIQKNRYDFMLFDVNVPSLDGFELLKTIRQDKNETPVILVTSLNSTKDLKYGFDIGANDYLKKPFDFMELEARINYLISSNNLNDDKIKLNDEFTLDTNAHELQSKTQKYKLSKKEFEIISFFIKHKNQLITHETLISNIWLDNIPTNATIRTYIKHLRDIIGKDTILSIKGIGYKLNT